MRKINQVKKQSAEGSTKAKLDELNKTLFELRVDLNYILVRILKLPFAPVTSAE